MTPFDSLSKPLTVVAEQAQSKGLELEAVLEGEIPPRINVDPFRLRQVLLNLLGNGVKFTDSGYVRLRIAAIEGGLIYMCVEDSGRGIAKAAQAEVFSAFSQVDGSFARSHEGTGLGLSITQRLVKGMGGDIGLESEPGRGSRFYFTFPTGIEVTEREVAGTQLLSGVQLLVVGEPCPKAGDLPRPEPSGMGRGGVLRWP